MFCSVKVFLQVVIEASTCLTHHADKKSPINVAFLGEKSGTGS